MTFLTICNCSTQEVNNRAHYETTAYRGGLEERKALMGSVLRWRAYEAIGQAEAIGHCTGVERGYRNDPWLTSRAFRPLAAQADPRRTIQQRRFNSVHVGISFYNYG
jgi:hypothetical protein